MQGHDLAARVPSSAAVLGECLHADSLQKKKAGYRWERKKKKKEKKDTTNLQERDEHVDSLPVILLEIIKSTTPK